MEEATATTKTSAAAAVTRSFRLFYIAKHFQFFKFLFVPFFPSRCSLTQRVYVRREMGKVVSEATAKYQIYELYNFMPSLFWELKEMYLFSSRQ